MRNNGILLMLLFLLNPLTSTGHGHQKKEKIKGTIVAYDWLLPLTNLTFAQNQQILIVRVEGQALKTASYVKVRYLYWHNEPSLPAEMLQTQKKWQFSLRRDKSCDGTVSELLKTERSNADKSQANSPPRLRRVPGSEKEEMPDDIVLPCYVLRPGDFE